VCDSSRIYSRCCPLRYNHLVKVKTSITLPEDLLQAIDRADSNRSSFLEKAARQYLTATAKARREARDAAILNARAETLNREALDVLEYQDLK
jgi:metal-responsive CopG/Arc/MetJ family transcriptional regulator